MTLRVAMPTEGQEQAATAAEALAHLLAVLDHAAALLRESGDDCDSQVIEAHRAALARGQEWPGDPVTAPAWASDPNRPGATPAPDPPPIMHIHGPDDGPAT